MSAYPWILKRPGGRRVLPPVKPNTLVVVVCERCGWESMGSRKKCPACLVRLGTEECLP